MLIAFIIVSFLFHKQIFLAAVNSEALGKRCHKVPNWTSAWKRAEYEEAAKRRRLIEEHEQARAELAARQEAIRERQQRVRLEKAREEAEEKARKEAMDKARREAEERARQQADERARRKAEEEARRKESVKLSRAQIADFECLGVAPGSSVAEITKAYRKKALKVHPDKGGDKAKFQQLVAAFERLTKEGRPGPSEAEQPPRWAQPYDSASSSDCRDSETECDSETDCDSERDCWSFDDCYDSYSDYGGSDWETPLYEARQGERTSARSQAEDEERRDRSHLDEEEWSQAEKKANWKRESEEGRTRASKDYGDNAGREAGREAGWEKGWEAGGCLRGR